MAAHEQAEPIGHFLRSYQQAFDRISVAGLVVLVDGPADPSHATERAVFTEATTSVTQQAAPRR